MYERLGEASLKDGQPMEIGVIAAPDADWRDYSPILVVEVVSPDTADKDLVRNRRLYLRVPGIREYWILDPRENPALPSMIVYRRQGTRWRRYDYAPGSTYTTRLLPGFELLLNSRT